MGPSQKHSLWNGMGAVPNSPACITDKRLYLVNEVGPPVPPSLLRTCTKPSTALQGWLQASQV